MEYLVILGAGCAGGVLRGMIGFMKHVFSYKDVSFKVSSFAMSVGTATATGGITAFVLREFLGSEHLLVIALVGGYAGSDILEGIGRMLLKKVTNSGDSQ